MRIRDMSILNSLKIAIAIITVLTLITPGLTTAWIDIDEKHLFFSKEYTFERPLIEKKKLGDTWCD